MPIIKLVPDEDFDRFIDIAKDAYPSMQLNTNEEKRKAKEKYTRIRNEMPSPNFYGLYTDGRLVGGMLLHDFLMTLHETEIKAGGVGYVCVDFLHKKEKIAKQLIEYFLGYYHEKKVNMALLYPFRPDFYKKMGFGFGTKANQYTIKPEKLPKGPSKTNIYFLSPADKSLVNDCHNQFAEKTHGMIKKTPYDMERLFDTPAHRIAGYKKNGKIMGYIVFSFRKDEKGNFLTNDIIVHEFIVLNRAAFSEIMTFLHSQNDQIRHIVFNTQDEYFHHLLADPRNETGILIPPVYHESNTQGVGLMYRAINSKRIFEDISTHNFGGQNCRIRFAVADSFMSENNTPFVIDFTDGRAVVSGDGHFDAEVAMDISDFSSLLMGVVSFESLYRYGLAEISDKAFVDTISQIFSSRTKPMCTMFF